jgi:hypothetical protein
MPVYSKELIAECIACFRDEDGIELTKDEAAEYLAGLGGLFHAFATSAQSETVLQTSKSAII